MSAGLFVLVALLWSGWWFVDSVCVLYWFRLVAVLAVRAVWVVGLIMMVRTLVFVFVLRATCVYLGLFCGVVC